MHIPETVTIPIDQLKVDSQNPNRMSKRQHEALAESIKRFGFINPIITNKDLLIADGEQRWTVAKSLGMKEVSVIRLPVSDVNRRLLRQVLNKLKGEHLQDMDSQEFLRIVEAGERDTLKKLINISDAGVEKYLDSLREVKEDEIPDVRETSIQRGDIYQLGNHRLMCGDATNRENIEKLMNSEKANVILTDPPYNLNMKYSSIGDNKGRYNYEGLCLRFFNLAWQFCNSKMIITCGKQNLSLWLKHTQPRDIAVWFSKNKMSGGRISYLSLWEPILFYGEIDRTSRPTDIFDYNVKQQPEVGNHPCPKILPFFVDLIKHYSSSKDIIADYFGGSGTTLMACEQTDRICYMMEIDPSYCQVIIDRWENYTKREALKIN